MLLLWLAACSDPQPLAAVPDTVPQIEQPEPVAATYADIRADLDARRKQLAALEDRPAARVEAREVVVTAITRAFIPAWRGTPWTFYGATETPREGAIACGYFVSTVLQDAGLRVERVRMAQQASENILKSLVPKSALTRFSNRSAQDVVEHVAAAGDGLWIVGLDFHVGFLWSHGGQVDMCHSSWVGASGVKCEDALTSEAFVSAYRVVGELFADDPLVDAWLDAKPIKTVGNHRG